MKKAAELSAVISRHIAAGQLMESANAAVSGQLWQRAIEILDANCPHDASLVCIYEQIAIHLTLYGAHYIISTHFTFFGE